MASVTSSCSLHHRLTPNSISTTKTKTAIVTNPFPPNPSHSLSCNKEHAFLKKSIRPITKVLAINRNNSSDESRETILLPGCDYNHWLIVMEFPKDPAPTREQMIDTYLNTLAQVLGSMEEAKKNMYAFSTTTYTGFQCTVSEETSEKFKGLPGVLWVLPDSYIDVKNKDYGGDKYINGEIIPGKPPTVPLKKRNNSKYESRRYERKRDGPVPARRSPSQAASQTESS